MTLPISSISLIRSLKQHIGQLSRQAKAEVRGAALPACPLVWRLATAQESAAKPGTALPLACRGRLRMLPMRAAQNNLPLHIRRRSRTRSQSCILATTNGFLIWSGDPLPGVLGRREQRLHYFDHFVFAKLYQLLVILVKIYANRFTTGFQSPAWNCRSRLTVGYQGLSSRPFSQRQSASVCKRR